MNFNAVLKTFETSLDKAATKVICYISRDCEMTPTLQSQLRKEFGSALLIVLRVGRLPRDALVELEILANTNTKQLCSKLGKVEIPEDHYLFTRCFESGLS